MYQYPARMISNNQPKIGKKGIISVDLNWGDVNETKVDSNLTAHEIVQSLGRKYGYDEKYCQLCCIKTVGEASYLLGDHKLSEYSFIQENEVPSLVIVSWDSIDIDMANDAIYMSLEKDVLLNNSISASPSGPPSPKSLPRKTSLTSMSLNSLAFTSPFQWSMIYSRYFLFFMPQYRSRDTVL